MPLQATSGAASYDAFGGGVAAVPNYIEDVFSTYLIKPSADYTTYSINNGIDLSTKGGMTWFKARDAAQNNLVYDTARGSSSGSPNPLITNGTQAQQTAYFDYVTPNTNGFTVNYLSGGGQLTNSGINYVSWTFRKQPKFFDVVTYTGNGAARTISHSLGSVPACIIVKQTSAAGEDWAVYHRGLPLVAGSLNDNFLTLNTTSAYSTSTDIWNRTVPTSTVFSVGNHPSTNSNGASYVAYLFAHNAGGFGLTGTDNVISCGMYTGGAGGIADVNLGYEPQFVITKIAVGTDPSAANDWYMVDNMRGWTVNASTGNATLSSNTSAAEVNPSSVKYLTLNATGFKDTNCSSSSADKYIYIAIRRGPMKVPTSGTSVFQPVKITATPTTTVTTNFPVDSVWNAEPNAVDSGYKYTFDRLRGGSLTQQVYLITSLTNSEANSAGSGLAFDSNVSVVDKYWGTAQGATSPIIFWNFRRAPSFFDEVCYTGTGSATTVTHNLGVAPELMIIKDRTAAQGWPVYNSTQGNTKILLLNSSGNGFTSSTYWNSTTPTSSVFTVGTNALTNSSGSNFVAYLFATCAGVSKVGSYTGTGTTKQVDCGFTSGARFVLIKRTDSTGDWYVWDSARGIVSGNDPYLLLNSTAAEVTSTDYIDTYSAGFEISSTAPAAINASGGTFIFLAIA